MPLSVVAFLVLMAVFAWGAATPVNAGLAAIVAAYAIGVPLAGLSVEEVTARFPAGLFFTLLGTTLLFSILRAAGTIDLLAHWAGRLARGRPGRAPLLMFALAAALATAGAFTPAAVAVVAPVALALGARFGVGEIAMGLVVVQGANAGAFSPANPFGVIAGRMLDQAGAPGGGAFALYAGCFLFNAALAATVFAVAQRWAGGPAAGEAAPAPPAAPAEAHPPSGAPPVRLDAFRAMTLLAVVSLLVLTLGFGLDVGVAALFASLALVAARPAVQKPALAGVPWSAILLVTGVVTYVGVLERIGAVAEAQALVAAMGDGPAAALVVCYLVAFVSAFASTTGTLGAATPVVAAIATDPSVSPLGVVTAVGVAASVVDISPMSTSGALLLASALPKNEALFFRALLAYAAAMVAVAPLLAWLAFVRSGLF
ncbi:SLC13 family permease [Craurococcus roseus]|uniref:SLC13 family permease n=1 Tax=Craurococcus roseus TaxID=77585 RepID=A0ABN1FXT3_9PROT